MSQNVEENNFNLNLQQKEPQTCQYNMWGGGGDVLARLPDLPGNMLAGAGLREEGIEAVVSDSDRLVARHLPIRLDTWTQIQNIKEVQKI